MISAFIIIGTTAKFLNLKLKKRREALKIQEKMMGTNSSRSTLPSKVEVA